MIYFSGVKTILTLIILILCYDSLFAGNGANFANKKITATESVAERDSLFVIAGELLTKSKPDEALFLLFDLLHKIDDKYSEEGINYQIALTEAYREKHEFEKGQYILYKILRRSNISPKNKAHAYNRMAALYNEGSPEGINRNDSVVKYSEMCIDISQKNGFYEYIALSQNEIGFVYDREGDPHAALSHFLLAYDGFEKIGDIDNAANVAINLSHTYWDMGNERMAINILDSTLVRCEPTGNKNLMMRLNLTLSDYYHCKGDMNNAYKYIAISRKQQEDFFYDRQNTQINEMAAKYELHIKEACIKEQQQQKNIYLIMLLATCVTLVVMIAIFRLKRKIGLQKRELANAENEKLKDRLKYKNKELTANTVLLAQMSSFTSKISEQIKTALPNTNKMGEKILVPIIEELESGYHKDIWKEFELSFKNINSNFYTKLHAVAPDLTPNELKVCAFLKLNMSTKDIAALTQRSHRTVDSIRFRIRQKLNMVDTDINLVNFLMEL